MLKIVALLNVKILNNGPKTLFVGYYLLWRLTHIFFLPTHNKGFVTVSFAANRVRLLLLLATN